MKPTPFAAIVAASMLVPAAFAFGASSSSSTASAQTPSPAFSASFDTPDDFYDRFDRGFSGLDPNLSTYPPDTYLTYPGDHNAKCDGPNTSREVSIVHDKADAATYEDFDEMFWWCAPKGPESGHLMTGVITGGYNIAWFSPKPVFDDVRKVCWDINVTQMSSRKWTQVLFVTEEESHSYPSERGSGGYDLGFTNPIFRADNPDSVGPSTGIDPKFDDLAGLQILQNGWIAWFEGSDHWAPEFPKGEPVQNYTDKMARYTHCIEQVTPDTIRITQDRPESHGGSQQVDKQGKIPAGPVRVVFQDDNYNPPKADEYLPDTNTWHWDNIEVWTDDGADRGPIDPDPTVPDSTVPDTTVPDTTMPTDPTPSDPTPAWPDFDGDGTADYSTFSPNVGGWHTPGQEAVIFGQAGDRPVPANYDSDPATERAVFRDGIWLIEGQDQKSLGRAGDKPVPADYDGDGVADIAVYRDGTWLFEDQSSVEFGRATDVPVPGDYDGDGTADLAVYRPETGAWLVEGQPTVVLGLPTDIPVPADYDGDGTVDRAVYRPGTGEWLIEGLDPVRLGTSTDIPVPADYNGDGAAERAVYHPAVGGWTVEGQSVSDDLWTDIPLAIPAAIHMTYFG